LIWYRRESFLLHYDPVKPYEKDSRVKALPYHPTPIVLTPSTEKLAVKETRIRPSFSWKG
jgi:hypothetical protein